MVDDKLGVVNEVPVPSEAPPDAAAYQFIVPADAVAPKATVPVPHLEPLVVPVIIGIVYTCAPTSILLLVVHPLLVAST